MFAQSWSSALRLHWGLAEKLFTAIEIKTRIEIKIAIKITMKGGRFRDRG